MKRSMGMVQINRTFANTNFTNKTMRDILDQSLEARQHKIQTAREYLQRTRQLFDAFGSSELKSSHAKFAELLNALDSDAIRLVVLGEFSRGKSSLVNALLGIKLLPTALQATTAINTFVRMLPEGCSERFIRVHYQDGRPAQEISWTDDSALERWGTELDESHADARSQVDYIEAFMDHPLLAKGLVLVDTPGLQSVMAHHEAITRKAIAEAHIALWVQNTTQLGGTATEWDFLSDTIRNNFRKFITVIGWWDEVLDPEDARDQQKPLEERVAEKLNVVKNNFMKYLQDACEVEQLTNANHLIPVSATWAMSKDPSQQSRSGIDLLAKRIAEMFSSGEALEQIYSKPLKQLSNIQRLLAEALSDEIQQLESDKTLEARARELEVFDQDIKLLKQEADGVARDSREEHDRVARLMVEKIRRELVMPLAELKADIENQVDVRYVQRQIDKRVKNIELPEDLHTAFQTISHQVSQAWSAQKEELGRALEGLSADYSTQMEKHAGQIRGEMSKLDVEVPALDISFKLDFDSIEQHHRQAMELNQEISARQNEIETIETEISNYAANKAQLEMARQAVTRAERMIDNLGAQPTPIRSSRREVVKKGGTYSSDTYGDVPYTDNSNVTAWQAEREKMLKTLADKEVRVEQIAAEEEKKTGLRMSLEKAQKKYEREVADFEKKKAAYEQQARAAQSDLVQETTQKLIKNTAGQLDQRIRYLQDHVADAIYKVFSDQLKVLKACVEEQYLEPLNAKRVKREEIQSLLQQGDVEISQRKASLRQAQQQVNELLEMTESALQN